MSSGFSREFRACERMDGFICRQRSDVSALHAFVLDRPVCLYSGIWHGVVTLTQEYICKITENLKVPLVCEPLTQPICIEAV